MAELERNVIRDITYVRLREIFQDLRAELALAALNRALANRAIEPGIVHHSDRGVQYCCHAYVETLQAHGFAISMSRTATRKKRAPRFTFIEEVYNRKRLHSALGYLSPDAFEGRQGAEPGAGQGGPQ